MLDPTSSLPFPTGLWLRAVGTGTLMANDAVGAAFRATPDDARFTLLLGAPGEPLPELRAVVRAVRSLDDAVRERLVLTVYGTEADARVSFAQRLADAMDTPIRTHHGLPTTDPDGTSHRTAIDPTGHPTWRPFAQLCTYQPGQSGVVVDRWQAPHRGANMLGPALYRLTSDWVIDIVPAGLVVRPTATRSDPLLCSSPTHPERVDLVIVAPESGPLPDDMLTALGRLGDSLPSAARSRLRLVLTPEIGALSERALQWAVPAPQVSWNQAIGIAPSLIRLSVDDVIVDDVPEAVVDDVPEAFVDDVPEAFVDDVPQVVVDDGPEEMVDDVTREFAVSEVVVDGAPHPEVGYASESVASNTPQPIVDESPKAILGDIPRQFLVEETGADQIVMGAVTPEFAVRLARLATTLVVTHQGRLSLR